MVSPVNHIKSKSLLKWLCAILGVMVISGILIKSIAEPYIKRQLIDRLNPAGSVHSISVQHINIRWILPGLVLTNITVINKQNLNDIRLQGTIKSVKLERINILGAVFRNDFIVRNIEINEGKFKILSVGRNNRKPIISKNRVRIGGISLHDMDAEIRMDVDSQSFSFSGLQARLEQFELSNEDTFHSGSIKVFDLNLSYAGMISDDSLRIIQAHGLKFSDVTGLFGIDSLSIIPRYKNYEFTGRFPYQTDRIEVYLRDINMHDFSIARLFGKGDFISSYISVEDLHVDAFRDKRKIFRHIPRKMLQEEIYSYPGILHIDSLRINDGKVTYSEHAEDSEEPGSIFFNRLNISFKNISNNPEYRNTEAWLVLNGRAYLMDKADAYINLKARLFDPNHNFTVKGTLGKMELNTLNPIFEKNEFIRLSGENHSMEFEFTANNQKASGSLVFLYSKLKVEIKNKDGFLRDKLKTWLLNYTLVNSNPEPGKLQRSGAIEYKRDPERFIFNYSVKTLMTGIKSTIITE